MNGFFPPFFSRMISDESSMKLVLCYSMLDCLCELSYKSG